MILNSWVLALMIGQIGVFAINGVAFINAIKIIKKWDIRSFHPEQLELERRSELISTIISWSLVFEIFSLIVFERTADSLAPFIPGAMCPVGVLGSNRWGYPTLFIKMIGLFVYGWWLVIHYIDIRIEGFPLTLLKNRYGLILFPFLFIDVFFQFIFFSSLDPSVITSCCGVVFEPGGGQSYASSVASLPPEMTRWVLGLYGLGFWGLSLGLRWEMKRWSRTVHALASLSGFFLGIAAVIAFTAPYIYQMPALHCPFCIMKPENYYFGYLVYSPLFIATFFGLCSGSLNLLHRRYDQAINLIEETQIKMIRLSRMFWILFLTIAFLPMMIYLWHTGGTDLFFGQSFQE